MDALLWYTQHEYCYPGAISQNVSNKQVLDKLQVERERGITVKAQVGNKFNEISNCYQIENSFSVKFKFKIEIVKKSIECFKHFLKYL